MTENTVVTSAPLAFARRLGYGIVVWAVPYATALALLPLSRTDPALFKTIEIVEGSLFGALVTVVYFEAITHDFLREGLLLGAIWMVESWLLDFVGILPFTKLTVVRYFFEIGFEYFAMLATTVAVGYVLERRLGRLR